MRSYVSYLWNSFKLIFIFLFIKFSTRSDFMMMQFHYENKKVETTWIWCRWIADLASCKSSRWNIKTLVAISSFLQTEKLWNWLRKLQRGKDLKSDNITRNKESSVLKKSWEKVSNLKQWNENCRRTLNSSYHMWMRTKKSAARSRKYRYLQLIKI